MVTRKRLNLSLAEIDFQRLCDIASSEGKLPTTYASDLIKIALNQVKRIYKPTRTLSEGFSQEKATPVLPITENRLNAPLMTRQQRRALERQSKKGKK